MWSEKVPPPEQSAPPASPRTKQEPDISFPVKITKEKKTKRIPLIIIFDKRRLIQIETATLQSISNTISR